ncbi:MAG: leucine-rich repeat protein, partial [Bacilli bacterium]|nr:leucine-rich repeat protein [Bacilli bacterium]
MKKKLLIVLTVLVVFITGTVSFLYVKKNNIGKNTTKELINISKLSEEFMDDYLEDIKDLNKEGNLESILIVISKRDVKDGYGAKKVIKAPNNQYILQYDSDEAKEKAMEELKNDSYVLSVEENVTYELFNDSNESSDYNSWGIEAMGLDNLMGNMSESELEDVTVAIIDTGLDVDLFNKYYNGRIKELKSVVGDKMFDSNGHGTHIAGTIAEGTLDNVKILPVKQTDESYISEINIIAAINWVVYNQKADVINMSFGSSIPTEAIYQALEAAKLNKIIPLAAAGNDDSSRPFYPAAYDNTISIASVDSQLNKSEFSNYGDTITFAAPGTGIKSLMSSSAQISQQNIMDGADDQDNEFETISGTSMATPHAVCAVALLKSFNNNLSIDNVINILKAHAIDLGDDGWDQYFGYGFINFSAAELCDDSDCDTFDIFKNSASMIQKIETVENEYISWNNYGNETNILNIQLKLYYSDDQYITKDLGELKNYTIENYDPNLRAEQEVTINYKGFEIEQTVDNYLNPGWTYTYFSEANHEISINGFVVEGMAPRYVIVPETYDGNTIVEMYSAVFENQPFLRKVKFLANIPSLPFGMFENCTNLSYVELPTSLRNIEPYAFYNTPLLNNIDLPEGLTQLEHYAFYESGLSTITIPSGVKTIPESAFANSGHLREVIISEGVETIDTEAFRNDYSLTTVSIPKTVTEIAPTAFYYDYLVTDLSIDDENEVYESEEGSSTIVEKDSKILVFASYYSTIPEEVHILGPYSINAPEYRLPENITRLMDYSLAIPECVVFSRSIDTVDSSLAIVRDAGDDWVVNLVYTNSYMHQYLEDHEIKYNLVDDRTVTVANKGEYKAFEKADDNIDAIIVTFAGEQEYGYSVYNMWTAKNYTVSYIDNRDSFRYGDEYFTIDFDLDLIGEHFSEKVYVTVSKETPEYTTPTGLSIDQGQALSTITLPSGFSWNDPDTIAEEAGTQTFLATYTPQDTDNYKIVDDVEIEVTVNKVKQIINPNITISDKTFDGTNEVSTNSVSVSNLEAGEYTIISIASDNINVGEATATVTLRLTNEKFEDYTFADGL